MEKKIRFPDYCCFGKLQRGFPRKRDDEITAVYKLFGEKVHELTYSKKRKCWTLQQFAPDGKRLMLSSYKTLNMTITNHAKYLVDNKHPVMEKLREELAKLGQVTLAPIPSYRDEHTVTAHSPAGKLMAIRLLISSGDDFKDHMKRIEKLIEFKSPFTRLRLRLHDLYETSYIVRRYDGVNYWHMVWVAEYIVPLAFVYDAVKLFYNKGLLKKKPLNRVFIQETSLLRKSQEQLFFLTDDPKVVSYAVLLKGLLLSHKSFEPEKKEFEDKYMVKAL